MGLVEVENALDRQDTRVLLGGIVLDTLLLLEEVCDTSSEGADQSDSGLSASSGLSKREEESKVAVNALLLQLTGSLNTLPGRGNLNKNALLLNT